MRRLAGHSCLITLTILAGAGALVPSAAQADYTSAAFTVTVS